MNKQIPKKKREGNDEKSPAFLNLQQMSTEGLSYGTKTQQSHTFQSPIPVRYKLMSAQQLKTERTQNNRSTKCSFKLEPPNARKGVFEKNSNMMHESQTSGKAAVQNISLQEKQKRLEQIVMNHQNIKQRLDSENFDTFEGNNYDFKEYLDHEMNQPEQQSDFIDHNQITIFQRNRSRTKLQDASQHIQNNFGMRGQQNTSEGIGPAQLQSLKEKNQLRALDLQERKLSQNANPSKRERSGLNMTQIYAVLGANSMEQTLTAGSGGIIATVNSNDAHEFSTKERSFRATENPRLIAQSKPVTGTSTPLQMLSSANQNSADRRITNFKDGGAQTTRMLSNHLKPQSPNKNTHMHQEILRSAKSNVQPQRPQTQLEMDNNRSFPDSIFQKPSVMKNRKGCRRLQDNMNTLNMCPNSVSYKINGGGTEQAQTRKDSSGSALAGSVSLIQCAVEAFTRGANSRVSSLGAVSGDCSRGNGASAKRFKNNDFNNEDTIKTNSLSYLQRKIMNRGQNTSRQGSQHSQSKGDAGDTNEQPITERESNFLRASPHSSIQSNLLTRFSQKSAGINPNLPAVSHISGNSSRKREPNVIKSQETLQTQKSATRIHKISEYSTKNFDSKNSANSYASKDAQNDNKIPDNFGLKAFTHRQSQHILSLNQIKFAPKPQREDELQHSIQQLEVELVRQYRNYGKNKNISKLRDIFQRFLTQQNDYCKLQRLPSLVKNLKLNDNQVQKPLLHFIVENTIDVETVEILKYSLELGFNPNIQNQENETALHINFKKNNTTLCCKITELLVQYGGNPCLLTTSRQTPVHFLVTRSSTSSWSCRCIHTLCRQALESSAQLNLDTRNKLGQSALHLAIIWNKPYFVKQLLESGSSPIALWVSNPTVSQNLISSSIKPSGGYRPLHLACQIGSKEILSMIIISLFENISNFQLNEKTEKGEDPLDLIINNCLANQEENIDERNNTEILECIKLLVGTGHMIRQRHVSKLRRMPAESNGSNFVQSVLAYLVKTKEERKIKRQKLRNQNQLEELMGCSQSQISQPSVANLNAKKKGALAQASEDLFSCDIQTLTQQSKSQCEYQSITNNPLNLNTFEENDPDMMLKTQTPSNQRQKMSFQGQEQQYTTNDHDDLLRQEMLQQLDGFDDGMGLQVLGDPKSMFSEKVKHQMVFDVIFNRKGEKVLTIQGFNPNDKEGCGLSAYGEENDSKENEEEEDQILFINLNKLANNKNNFNMEDKDAPNDFQVVQTVQDKQDYLTENPYTKVLDQFPNKLSKEDAQNVTTSKEIGSGAHAKVYLGEYLDTPVAIKVYENHNPLSLNAFISELEAFYRKPSGENQLGAKVLSHPNIVQVLGAYQNGNQSYLINELSELGSLNLQRSLSPKMKISASLQVAQALNYLHSQANVYHRDIKSENVLIFSMDHVKSTIQVKLCDFGISKQFDPLQAKSGRQFPVSPPSVLESKSFNLDELQQTQTLGTIPWMAPEFLEHKVFSEKSDIYSFGIFLYEIFCCDSGSNLNPYGDMQGIQIMFQVTNKDLRPEITRTIESTVDKKVLDLMKACWSKHSNERPTARQIIQLLKQV